MKTMKWLTLGLVLFSLCCCSAMPKAQQLNTAPGNCCFNFSTRSLPLTRVRSITESHSSCLKRAFIVHMVRGKKICYSQTFPWALHVYSLLHKTDGSGQQH